MAGDTIQFYQWVSSGGDSFYVVFKWGLQNGKPGYDNQNDGYGLSKHKDGSTWNLTNCSSGGVASGSYTPPQQEWLRIEIDWGTDGTINVKIFDSSDTKQLDFSGTDTDYTDGGIGFEVNPVPGSASMTAYFDSVQTF